MDKNIPIDYSKKANWYQIPQITKKVEYRDHASAFAEATNVFLPYYRQSGLKFATGECDTGVIVAWNTEGPRNVETNAHNLVVLPKTRSINPLNWKLDETYAPASLNLGSVVLDEVTGEPEIGDVAKASAAFFGADGRHAYDYMCITSTTSRRTRTSVSPLT